jgi:hypothetical protein
VGFAERKALKRGERVLAPYAEPGETVEDFDVGYVGRTKVDLIATDRTLWLFPSAGGDLLKFPYVDIRAAIWHPNGHDGVLEIVTRSGQTIVEIRAPRGLGPDLQRRIAASDHST